jgi:uncharacterized protein
VKLENSFTVDAPAEAAWDLLMDVPRIVPCMPGAALDEVVDDSHWKATMQVKLGPIGLTFATDVERTEADEAAKRVVLKANARDVRNRGRAEATIESSLAPANGATRIDLVQDISSQLVTSFAQCLQAQLSAAPEEAEAATAAQAKPVGGLGLFFGAMRRKLARLFGRRPE